MSVASASPSYFVVLSSKQQHGFGITCHTYWMVPTLTICATLAVAPSLLFLVSAFFRSNFLHLKLAKCLADVDSKAKEDENRGKDVFQPPLKT